MVDLDAELRKVRTFMNDMHAIFPGGVEGLKAAAVAARNGEPMRVMGSAAAPAPAGFEGEMERLVQLGARLEGLLPEIESLMGGIGDVIGRVAALEEAVTKLEQAVPASEEPNGEGSGETGTKDPAVDQKASATS